MATLPTDIVSRMLAKDAFSAWLGITVKKVELGCVIVSMTVRADMLNGFGRCHGGIPFALADSALAFAANTHGKVAVAIDNQISYPAPISEGDTLIAEAHELGRSNKLGFYSVTVTRGDGIKVALFKGTVYITEKDF